MTGGRSDVSNSYKTNGNVIMLKIFHEKTILYQIIKVKKVKNTTKAETKYK